MFLIWSVLMTFVGQFNQKADMLMDRLQTLADNKTLVHLFEEFNHATLDAIAQVYERRVSFGDDIWFNIKETWCFLTFSRF